MPLSLKSQLKKLAHKGQITAEEYDALVDKLAGHDRELRASVIDEFADTLLDNLDPIPVSIGEHWMDMIPCGLLRSKIKELSKQLKEE